MKNGHKTLPISSQEQVSRCEALGQKFYEGQLKVLGEKEVQGELSPSLPLPEKRLKPGGSFSPMEQVTGQVEIALELHQEV